MTTYDVAVVGLGMIGSAALRHLSVAGLRVIGIGPAEPDHWAAHEGAFASHYDQARITRITDPDSVWGMLAQRSIARYAEIERHSGVRFHHAVGHLRVSPDVTEVGDTLGDAETIGRQLNAQLTRLTQAQLSDQFPYLQFADKAEALYEVGAAGFVNPRKLVAAQQVSAFLNGAKFIYEEVHAITGTAGAFEVRTQTGQILQAQRVLLSMDGYTNFLLKPFLGRELDFICKQHSVVLAELDEAEQQRLANCPSLIWRLQGHPLLKSFYSTPPTPYPDGRVCFKIGGSPFSPPTMNTPQAFRDWFHGAGNEAEIAALREVLLAILPGLRVKSWASKPCVNTYTAHGYPYVDRLAEGVYICTGGCGSAAKSCDEIGRMGASLAQHDEWRSDLPVEIFRAV